MSNAAMETIYDLNIKSNNHIVHLYIPKDSSKEALYDEPKDSNADLYTFGSTSRST